MSDPRRFWKESVGVVSRRTEKGAQPGPPSTTVSAAPPPPEGATAIGLVPIEQALAALPLGSIVFAEHVGRSFWAEPTPSDLKALAAIAERRRTVPAGVQRDTVLRCLQVRQRVQRLLAPTPRSVGDPRPWQLRAAEWARLVRLTAEAHQEVDALPDGANAPVFAAARQLLPDPADVEAEALLAEEVSHLCYAGLAERNTGAETAKAFSLFPEALALLEAVQTGSSGPDDEVFLEILAGYSLTSRLLAAQSKDGLERLRRALSRVASRLDRAVAAACKEHERDPERKARLAHWRRRLADTRSLVDESITRPGAERAAPLPAPSQDAGLDSEGAERRMREHLRRVQRKAGVEPEPEGPPENPDDGWRRWLPR